MNNGFAKGGQISSPKVYKEQYNKSVTVKSATILTAGEKNMARVVSSEDLLGRNLAKEYKALKTLSENHFGKTAETIAKSVQDFQDFKDSTGYTKKSNSGMKFGQVDYINIQTGRTNKFALNTVESVFCVDKEKTFDNYTKELFSLTAPREVFSTGRIFINHEKEILGFENYDTNKFYRFSIKQGFTFNYIKEDTISGSLDLTGYEEYNVLVATADGVKLGMGETFTMMYKRGDAESVVKHMDDTAYNFVSNFFNKAKAEQNGVKLESLVATVLRYAAINTASVEFPSINCAFFTNGLNTSATLPSGKTLAMDGMSLLSRSYIKRANVVGPTTIGLQSRAEFEKVFAHTSEMIKSIFVQNAIVKGGVLKERCPQTGQMVKTTYAPKELTVSKAIEIADRLEYLADNDGRKIRDIEDPTYDLHVLKLVKEYDQKGNICGQIFQKLVLSNSPTKALNSFYKGFVNKAKNVLKKSEEDGLGYSLGVSAFPRDFDSATEKFNVSQSLKQFCETTNSSQAYTEAVNSTLIANVFNLYAVTNVLAPEGQEVEVDGKIETIMRPGAFYAQETTPEQDKEIEESKGFLYGSRLPASDVTSGLIFKVYTQKDLPLLKDRISNINILKEIKDQLGCSDKDAQRVQRLFIANALEYITNLKTGLIVDAHEDVTEPLSGSDYDTDTAFVVFSAPFASAVQGHLRCVIRDFDSLETLVSVDKVNTTDMQAFYRQVCQSPYQIIKNTHSSVGIETAKVEKLITLLYLVKYKGATGREEVPTFLSEWYVGLLDTMEPETAINRRIATDSYTSPILFKTERNELGFDTVKTVIDKDVVLTMKERIASFKFLNSKTPIADWTKEQRQSVSSVLYDCIIAGAFVGDVIIDAAKKLYKYDGLQLPGIESMKLTKGDIIEVHTERNTNFEAPKSDAPWQAIARKSETKAAQVDTDTVFVRPMSTSKVRNFLSAITVNFATRALKENALSFEFKARANREVMARGMKVFDELSKDLFSLNQFKSLVDLYNKFNQNNVGTKPLNEYDTRTEEEIKADRKKAQARANVSFECMLHKIFNGKMEDAFLATYFYAHRYTDKNVLAPLYMSELSSLTFLYGAPMFPILGTVEPAHHVDGLVLDVTEYKHQRPDAIGCKIVETVTTREEFGFTISESEFKAYSILPQVEDMYQDAFLVESLVSKCANTNESFDNVQNELDNHYDILITQKGYNGNPFAPIIAETGKGQYQKHIGLMVVSK